MKKTSIVILAAGKSRRMKGTVSKVFQLIAGRPLLDYVNEVAFKNSTSGVYYVCSKEVKKYVNNKFLSAKTIIQKIPLGTAHAVECIDKLVQKKKNDVIVLFGDVPLIKNSTIRKLIKFKNSSKSIGSIITFKPKDPFGYGRVIVNNNYVENIIEERDATAEQKKINLCNSGILICDSAYLFKSIKKITNNNNQKERFLTDICKIAFDENKPFTFFNCEETEVQGINSANQLIDLESKLQKILKNSLIKKGVNFIQPSSITVSYDTKIDRGVIVEPHTIIKRGVSIKKSSKILSGSYLEGCSVGQSCTVGPYARIRPKTIIDDNVKVGNFVEVKNSKIGKFSSISHLSYIGDATIGKNVNIGAGTITCNYDGIKKHKTIIDDGVFVGSNCSLIAPIKISKNSSLGAGSVITKNVPVSSLAVERSKLLIKRKKK